MWSVWEILKYLYIFFLVSILLFQRIFFYSWSRLFFSTREREKVPVYTKPYPTSLQLPSGKLSQCEFTHRLHASCTFFLSIFIFRETLQLAKGPFNNHCGWWAHVQWVDNPVRWTPLLLLNPNCGWLLSATTPPRSHTTLLKKRSSHENSSDTSNSHRHLNTHNFLAFILL